MAKDSFINLGRNREKTELSRLNDGSDSKVYYPSVYISGNGNLDLEDGDDVLIRGIVIGCTKTTRDGKTTYSCDVECRGIKNSESSSKREGLDLALSEIEKERHDVEDDE